jgi:nitroreductase
MEDDSVLHNKWTDVEKVILERRSVRLYQKKQVPDFLVKRILEAGRYAPSAGNCQPWKFIVIQDQQIINDLSKDLTHFFKTVKALIDYRSGNLKFVRKFLAKAAKIIF